MKKIALIIVLSALHLGCGGDQLAALRTIPGLSSPVVVRYDAQSVPHFRCAKDLDCLAIQGYVQARDRLFAMDVLRRTARARLAELIGVEGLLQDAQIRALFVTRAGHRVEDDLAAALDPRTRELLTAFARGVNARIDELRRDGVPLSGQYAQLPFQITADDLPPWTIEDTLAVGRLSQFQLSESLSEETEFARVAAVFGPGGPREDLGKLGSWVRSAAPATEQAHTLSPGPASAAPATEQAHTLSPGPASAPLARAPAAPASPRHQVDLSDWRDALAELSAVAWRTGFPRRSLDDVRGSNNWAISAKLSSSGRALVANDPHLPLQFPPLFHLVAMSSAEGLELTGASFPGIPGILAGRGAHVGWGVTVTGYDVTDLYLEQFLPQSACPGGAAGPPCVLFRSSAVSTVVVPQTFFVRVGAGGEGLVDARTLGLPNPPPPAVLVVPHHGPIVRAPDAAGRALSVRWTGQEGNTQDTRALLALGAASGVEAAVAALRDFSVGAQNFVIADDSGRIAYTAHALVPVRKFSEVPRPLAPWLPLPGDGSAEWGDGASDCAAAGGAPVPRSCWIAATDLPEVVDPPRGYLFTANSDPTFPSKSDDGDPLAHPPYLSFDWGDSSGFRATRIEQRIEDAIALRGKLSTTDVESIQADHVSRPGAAFAPHVARAAVEASPESLSRGKDVLARWAAVGWECPSGLVGSDPKTSTVAVDPEVLDASAGCLLFHAFLRTLLRDVFDDDLAAAGQHASAIAGTKAALLLLDLPDGAPGTSFCDDVDEGGKVLAQRTCSQQVARALAAATEEVEARLGRDPRKWVWGREHVARVAGPLASIRSPVGSVARPGGLFTVDVGNPQVPGDAGDFSFSAASNLRHVSVMDPKKRSARMQLPGRERDAERPAGPDLLEQWSRNQYFDLSLGSDVVEGQVTSTEVFRGK